MLAIRFSTDASFAVFVTDIFFRYPLTRTARQPGFCQNHEQDGNSAVLRRSSTSFPRTLTTAYPFLT
jgi:hypothetical protein